MIPPVVSIVGKSSSGKTTLIEKLIPELKRRGYRVGVIKHAFHNFEMDNKGKDSWRIKQAGADGVIVASRGRIGMVLDMPDDGLGAIVPFFKDMDIVITEGYKRGDKPKIEIFRSQAHDAPLCLQNSNLIGLVTDTDTDLGVPRFGLDDIAAIADLIEMQILDHC